jgi:hypothetical protein
VFTPSLITDRAAMANGKSRKRKRPLDAMTTPEPVPQTLTIGSSCTWGSDELEHMKVTIRRDVDVHEMIPARFFNFENLADYNDCTSSAFIVDG